MSTVEAIYQGGVFKPLGTVPFHENQRVRLSIQLVEDEAARTWLAEVRQLQQQVAARRGFLPDSTTDIAADRRRDD